MFAETVAVLSKADPMVVFRDLHNLYSEITQMSADQVVAAYQTLDTCAHINGSEDNPIVVDVKKALRLQMFNLCGHNQYDRTFERFKPFMK